MPRRDNFNLLVNQRGYHADFSWLPKLKVILKREFKIKQAISIALLSDQEILQLNKVYRRQNKITDVLSFNLDSPDILGEIVICLPQARRQAADKQRSLTEELQVLTIHGILHLLGYDHELSPLEYERQSKQEEKILRRLKS